jgi:hypothetical protein
MASEVQKEAVKVKKQRKMSNSSNINDSDIECSSEELNLTSFAKILNLNSSEDGSSSSIKEEGEEEVPVV